MQNSSPPLFQKKTINTLRLKKITSAFLLPDELISQKLLNFEFSRDAFLNLRSELLDSVFYFYNSRLFADCMSHPPTSGRIILARSDEASLEELHQSIASKTKIDPADIEMGAMGNSLFISAISALAETPKIIFSLLDQIQRKDLREIYRIFINQNGTWRELFLDSVLPYRIEKFLEDKSEKLLSSNKKGSKSEVKKEVEKKTLLFSRLKNNAPNWLGLIEKAYSFAYGSYSKMMECLLEDILYDLTGAVIDTLPIQKMSNFELGDFLLKNFNKGSPMLLVESDLNDRMQEIYQGQKTMEKWGIPIIDIRNTNTEYIIVKIRALTNLKKTKLTYNKGSNNWPPDLKTELGVKFDPDNVVWLSLDEIKNMFENLVICNINLRNSQKSLSFEFTEFETLSYAICYFQFNQPFNFAATLCQDDLREFESSSNYKYSKATIFIAKTLPEENRLKFIGAACGEKRNVGINFFLEKGNYLIYFEIKWDGKVSLSKKRIKLNIYSDSDCKVNTLNSSSDFRRNVLSNVFASVCNMQKVQKPEQNHFSTKNLHEDIKLISGTFLDYYCILVKNSILLKQAHKISIQIPVEGSYYTDLAQQTKNFSDKTVKIFLPPNRDIILIFNIRRKFADHPTIIKGIKQLDLENSRIQLQNYELRPFDVSFMRAEEKSKSSLNFRLFSRSEHEIISYVKKWGSYSKRVLNDKEIEVLVWFGAFEEGITYYIENCLKDKTYKEKITYKGGNLEIVKENKQKKILFGVDFVEMKLDPGKSALVKWIKIKDCEIYSYHFKNTFSLE